VVISHNCDCSKSLLSLTGGAEALNIKEEYMTYLGPPFLTVWTYPKTTIDACEDCTVKCGPMVMELEDTPLGEYQSAISFPGAVFITSWFCDNYDDMGFKVFDIKITLPAWPSLEFHIEAPFNIGECSFDEAFFQEWSQHEGRRYTYTLWQLDLYLPFGVRIVPACPSQMTMKVTAPGPLGVMVKDWVTPEGETTDSYCTEPELVNAMEPGEEDWDPWQPTTRIGYDGDGFDVFNRKAYPNREC